jgi:hypothetical protein
MPHYARYAILLSPLAGEWASFSANVRLDGVEVYACTQISRNKSFADNDLVSIDQEGCINSRCGYAVRIVVVIGGLSTLLLVST